MIPSKTISPVNANGLIAYARVESSFYEAMQLAVKLYAKQKREFTGVKYISHPLTVASILRDYDAPVSAMVSAVLAEALTRTSLKERTLRDKFGDEVADMVLALTPPKVEGDEAEAFDAYCAQLAASSALVHTIKMAEMLDKVCAIPLKELPKQQGYVAQCAHLLEACALGNTALARRLTLALQRARL